jgi:hypothetical protein
MARPSKLTDKTQAKIVACVEKGATVADACAVSGVSETAFYEWMQRGREGDTGYAEFADAVTRAREAAKVTAIETLHSAMLPTRTVSTTKEVYTETRVNMYGSPYEYKKATERTTVTVAPGDWRAAVEYLKRRYREEWSEKSIVEHQDWRSEALSLIRDGKLDYHVAVQEFGRDLAIELFESVGVSVADAGEATPRA